jgi:hypothetical protein
MEIIQKLIDEGLNIILFDNRNTVGHHQDAIVNRLAQTAVNTYGADIVFPLDADEFLYTSEGGNPRDFLEQLDVSEAYKTAWHVYMPPAAPPENGVFFPSCFNEIIRQFKNFKIIVGAGIIKSGRYWIGKGNHLLQSTVDWGFYDTRMLEGVFLAHYPIRSVEQAMTKVIIGWANALSTTNRGIFENQHWREMYESIKQKGMLTVNQLPKFAQVYAFTDQPHPETDRFPIETDITLRYTDYGTAQKNFFNLVLTNYERIIHVLMTSGPNYSVAESLQAVNE